MRRNPQAFVGTGVAFSVFDGCIVEEMEGACGLKVGVWVCFQRRSGEFQNGIGDTRYEFESRYFGG